MPAQWTGRIVGEIHNNGLTSKALAEELGWNEKYLSQVLNSENPPKKAEEKVAAALERLITRKRSEDLKTYRTWKAEVEKTGKSPEELLAHYEAIGMTEYARKLRAVISQMEAAL